MTWDPASVELPQNLETRAVHQEKDRCRPDQWLMSFTTVKTFLQPEENRGGEELRVKRVDSGRSSFPLPGPFRSPRGTGGAPRVYETHPGNHSSGVSLGVL